MLVSIVAANALKWMTIDIHNTKSASISSCMIKLVADYGKHGFMFTKNDSGHFSVNAHLVQYAPWMVHRD